MERQKRGRPESREIKFDVTWPYVKRQTARMTSQFVFFSSNLSLNHIKIEKCLLLIATNANIFTLLFNELKTDGKSFIFAVCRLTYDHVTSNLISLISEVIVRGKRNKQNRNWFYFNLSFESSSFIFNNFKTEKFKPTFEG